MRAALESEFPGNKIAIQAEQDILTLTGTVDSKEMADEAGKLAASYAKTVVNSLRVVTKREPQVELKLQILEVDRTKLEQLGFNIFRAAGNNVGAITTQQFPSTGTVSTSSGQTTVQFSDPLNFSIFNFAHDIGATVQALEQKNVVQILAEPTLTARSGQRAQFLSGGEFPFPVVQGGTSNGTAITIQFRPYGVKMEFTPVVTDDGTILLKVSPEVSALDYSNAVTISGYTIPALSTRRADTEVELRNGQTFAISGLLDHRTTEILSKIPGISNVPLLGQLFRSKNISHSVVELVVLVHAQIVDPVAQPGSVSGPAWAVPNMTQSEFDKELHQERPNDVPPLQNPVHPGSQQ
jgi:pilus assembly protein CpaC